MNQKNYSINTFTHYLIRIKLIKDYIEKKTRTFLLQFLFEEIISLILINMA